MAEVRDIVMRFRFERDDNGLKEVKEDLDKTSESGSKLSEVIGSKLGAALGTLAAGFLSIKTLEMGQAMTELSRSFDALGSGSLPQLRTAVQGLVSDMDLMRAANQAAISGLKPEQFLAVAKAADALGDAVGVDTKQAMDGLTQSIATGNERMAKQFGILIDSAKAERDFAASIGTTAEKLSEAGKLEAHRIAIIDEMTRKSEQLGDSTETVGDMFQKLKADTINAVAAAGQWINENETVITILQAIRKYAEEAGEGLANMFGSSLEAQITRAESQLQTLENDLKSLSGSFFANVLGGQDENTAAGMRGNIEGLKAVKALQDEGKILAGVYNDLNTAAGQFMLTIGEGTQLNRYIDNTKKAKDETKKFAESLGDLVKPISVLQLGLNTAGGDIAGTIDALYGGGIGSAFMKGLDEFDKGAAKSAEELQKKMEQAFKGSVSFFEDILTTTITGSSQSIEQILKDALKRVAIGFGAEMLASISTSLGFGGLSSLGSASGLGQAIAASFGFGGPGVKGIGSVLSGDASSLGEELSRAETSLAGSSASLASIAASMLPIVAGAAGILGIYQGITTGNKPLANISGAATFGLVTGGASAFLPGIASDFFGGNSQLAAEREWREQMLAQLFGEGGGSFHGVHGQLNLSASNFNIDTSDPIKGSAVGLANPFAEFFAGGDDKQQADLAAIFANATSEAKNFNEVLINTRSLMGELGVDTQTVKDGLTQLFLDGKISLDEFNTSMHDLNVISQDTLQGPNGIVEGFQVLADNILDDPRTALQALGLEFNTLAAQGIDSTDEIVAYMTQAFGPDAGAVFQQLADIGIHSFEDIKNASDEQIGQIFVILTQFADFFEQTFGESSDAAADAVERNMKRIRGSFALVQAEAEKASRAIGNFGSGTGVGGFLQARDRLATFRIGG